MKCNKKRIGFIVIALFICCGIYFVFEKDSAHSESVNDKKNTEEINKINEKISEIELTKKITNKLKENGYSPQGGIAYTIFSANKQMLTVFMYDIDLNNKKETDEIIAITNEIINVNNFNPFEIAIQKVER